MISFAGARCARSLLNVSDFERKRVDLKGTPREWRSVDIKVDAALGMVVVRPDDGVLFMCGSLVRVTFTDFDCNYSFASGFHASSSALIYQRRLFQLLQTSKQGLSFSGGFKTPQTTSEDISSNS
jgi:hypothetical protein